jgi:hypothetical protein
MLRSRYYQSSTVPTDYRRYCSRPPAPLPIADSGGARLKNAGGHARIIKVRAPAAPALPARVHCLAATLPVLCLAEHDCRRSAACFTVAGGFDGPDQSQACTRTHAQQPHNCRFPSAPSLRKLVGKVQHTSAHRLPGVCAVDLQGICSHTVHRTCSSYLGAREAPRGRSRPWGTRAERARCCLRHRARKAFSSARSLITRSARTRSVCVPASQLGRGVNTLIITRDGMV